MIFASSPPLLYRTSRGRTLDLYPRGLFQDIRTGLHRVWSVAFSLANCANGPLVNKPQGFCVDPSSNFVLAAGSDKRIRAWSLRTGEAIFPLESQDQQGTPGTNLASTADTSTARSTTETRNRSRDTLLHKAFNNPVTAIVLSDSRSSFEWGGVASSPNDTNKRQEQDSRASMLREIWVTAGRDVYCFSGSLALT